MPPALGAAQLRGRLDDRSSEPTRPVLVNITRCRKRDVFVGEDEDVVFKHHEQVAFDRVGDFQMRPYPFFQMGRAFKTPGLRNVALTAPYQHDGSEATLLDVVRFYNLGGRDPQSYGKALDIRPLNLNESQLDDLVSFLRALTMPVDLHGPATSEP